MSKVSVVMPAYNCASYIKEAIESVLSQTYRNFELIIIDDGSTDDTEEVVHRYKNDPRVKYKKIKHQGRPSVARNTGLRMASGNYIAFLDADDIMGENSLMRKIEFLRKFPDVHLIFSDYICFRIHQGKKHFDRVSYFQKNNNYIKNLSKKFIKEQNLNFYLFTSMLKQRLLSKLFICTSTVFVSKHALEEVGFFDEKLLYGEDWDLWVRILKQFGGGYIDETLSYIRHRKESLTKDRINFIVGLISLQKRFLNTERLNTEEISLIKKSLSLKTYEVGYRTFQNGNTSEARRWFLDSICYNLKEWKQLKYLLFTFLGDYFLLRLRRVKWKIESL